MKIIVRFLGFFENIFHFFSTYFTTYFIFLVIYLFFSRSIFKNKQENKK